MEILTYPFIQRAILAGILLASMTSIIGVLITMRHASFFGDAIAHSSLAGVALGLFAQLDPLLTALSYAIGMSFLLPWVRARTSFSLDNILGIFLPFSMGLGVLLFSLLPGYQPDLLSYLFGSIVSLTWQDVGTLAILACILTGVLTFTLPQMIFVSLDEEYARLIGIRSRLYDALFHMMLALVIIAGVRMVGIVLINALLIVPGSIAKLYAGSVRQIFILAPLISLSCTLGGISISIGATIPTGASIAVVSGAAFLVSLIVRGVEK